MYSLFRKYNNNFKTILDNSYIDKYIIYISFLFNNVIDNTPDLYNVEFTIMQIFNLLHANVVIKKRKGFVSLKRKRNTNNNMKLCSKTATYSSVSK